MKLRELAGKWPVVRELREGDALGLGRSVQSAPSSTLKPRIDESEHVVQSVCPYCAVGKLRRSTAFRRSSASSRVDVRRPRGAGRAFGSGEVLLGFTVRAAR